MSAPFSVQYKTEKPGVRYYETDYGFITYKLDIPTKTACILELYIHPGYRGEGFGKGLVEYVKNFAKETGMTTFMTTLDPNEDTVSILRHIVESSGLNRHSDNVKLEFEIYSQRIN